MFGYARGLVLGINTCCEVNHPLRLWDISDAQWRLVQHRMHGASMRLGV